ncbi:hypothetical protein COBT_002137 [Conglomerata obtusa]
MEYVAAYKMLHIVEREKTFTNMKEIFDSIGATINEACYNDLMCKIGATPLNELEAKGASLMALSAPAAVAKIDEPVAKVEEKVEEKKKVEDTAVDFDMFEDF